MTHRIINSKVFEHCLIILNFEMSKLFSQQVLFTKFTFYTLKPCWSCRPQLFMGSTPSPIQDYSFYDHVCSPSSCCPLCESNYT